MKDVAKAIDGLSNTIFEIGILAIRQWSTSNRLRYCQMTGQDPKQVRNDWDNPEPEPKLNRNQRHDLLMKRQKKG